MTEDRPHKEPGPDHPITIEPVNSRFDAISGERSAGGHVIAATIQPLMLTEADYEPVYYVPREHADMAVLERSDHTTWCPYKGEARYFHVRTDSGLIENAVWTYEKPFHAVHPIEKALAFYADKVTLDLRPADPAPGEANSVLSFWMEELEPKERFKADPKIDDEIEQRFGSLQRAAGKGEHDDWQSSPGGALALIILLDQFSRNLYRGSARAFANDAKALEIARAAVKAGHDLTVTGDQRAFYYMPWMHAEDMDAQDESVHLFRTRLPGTTSVDFAIRHRDIIEAFGRYPHRNEVLGREMTAEEQTYLDEGGETF
ncbi:DUF924 family protein [Parvularcula flava]|uniref:DUF924 family protein n=1 Tax=Aquisalinus luteolus TaxID=1566827 RepID=A0A8J3EPP8_9PROT|nr:DUF924 family protein [Aquisalinus luteolus]NHK28690.1 DUF924 family protein [Aquisalinus luteolus]GGH99226.1 hypothetical protein GCM10011355_24680 [Aquisalinus luteolus]